MVSDSEGLWTTREELTMKVETLYRRVYIESDSHPTPSPSRTRVFGNTDTHINFHV